MASFDENGKYIKTNWKAGDKITATKLNKIEESIEAVNDNDISRHVEADARLDALEAKDVAHDEELTNIKNTIADNKAAAELGDYEINSRMQFLEDELEEAVAEVNNVASTVDGKIAQGKADMEAMVAEVEADLEGLHAKDEELSEQLAYIENVKSITPDDFDGSDLEKVQQAMDYSIQNNCGIRINRLYDLTGGSISINKGFDVNSTELFTDNKGGFIKNDSGFMFTNTIGDKNRGDIRFTNICFLTEQGLGDCYVLNSDIIVGIFFNSCVFKYINIIKGTTYLQSLRLINSLAYGNTNYLIDVPSVIDCHIISNQFEWGGGVIKAVQTDTSSTARTINVLNIRNNVIEGRGSLPPIYTDSSIMSMNVCENYFEGNHNGCIEFSRAIVGNSCRQLNIDNNYFAIPSTGVLCAIVGFNNIQGDLVSLRYNSCNKDLIDNCRVTTRIDSTGTTFLTTKTDLNIIDIAQGECFKITKFDNGGYLSFSIDNMFSYYFGDYVGKSYIIHLNGYKGSSSLFKGVYVGILSFINIYSDSTIKTKAMLTPLSSHMGGTYTTTLPTVTCKFQNGSDLVDERGSILVDEPFIIETDFASTGLIGELNIIPLSQILTVKSSLFHSTYK